MVGWAVLEARRGTPRCIASGAWRLGRPPVALGERLLRLRRELSACVREHQPGLLALESAFFGKNARSSLRLGESRGVVMVTAAELGLAVTELAPALVKRRVAGAGAATKEQIARLVGLQLDLHAGYASADESDALALALCALLQDALPAPQEQAGSAPGPRTGTALPRGARRQ